MYYDIYLYIYIYLNYISRFILTKGYPSLYRYPISNNIVMKRTLQGWTYFIHANIVSYKFP